MLKGITMFKFNKMQNFHYKITEIHNGDSHVEDDLPPVVGTVPTASATNKPITCKIKGSGNPHFRRSKLNLGHLVKTKHKNYKVVYRKRK